MDEPTSPRWTWTAHLMLAVSVVVTLFLVPLSFVLAGPFNAWLQSVGVHAAPNLADGRLLASLESFERSRSLPPPAGAGDPRDIERALALRRFSVKKVAFRPGSGMGIAPRLNLSFEFDGALPDPHASTHGFSLSVIHVYIHAPGAAAPQPSSNRAACVDLAGPAWSHQVIIDGLHEQARIFDTAGKLVGRGLGLYVRRERAKQNAGQHGVGQAEAAQPVVTTRMTVALPMELLGDPERGDWAYYVLVGVTDSTSPSMMLHSRSAGRLELLAGALTKTTAKSPDDPAAKPILRPLIVKNRI